MKHYVEKSVPRNASNHRHKLQCIDDRMRILLQHKETGLYFKDIASWVRTSVEAMDFVSSTAAIDFCVSNKLSSVQLVLKFDEQQYDIVLPVRPLQDFGAECASAEG